VSLKQALERYAPDEGLHAELEFRPGFFITVIYWPELRLDKELKKSKRTEFVKHQKVERVSTDAFRERLAGAVTGWRGLTYKVLAGLGLVDLRKVEAEELEHEQPFSQEDLLALLKASPSFEGWLLEAVTDPDNFPLKEERGNSPATSGGGAPPDGSTATSAPTSGES
jgi:hypothetical protein